MSSYQEDVKYQKVKHLDLTRLEEVHTKNKLTQ